MLFRSVLAAVDFSTSSRAALAFAARLARAHGARLHVLYAQDPTLITVARAAGIDLHREALDHLEAFVAATQDAARCKAHLHVVFGAPAVAICREARHDGADVIIVGSRGLSDSPHVTLGATAEHVLRCANRPVLVLPHAGVPKAARRPARRSVSSRLPRTQAAEITPRHA